MQRLNVFRSQFFWKLYFTFAVLFFAVTSVIGFVLVSELHEVLWEDLNSSLKDDIVLITPFAKSALGLNPPTDINAQISQLAKDTDIRITVINPAGVVISESAKDPQTLENHLERPEVKQSLSSGYGISQRHSTTIGEELIYIAKALRNDKADLLGVLRLSVSAARFNSQLARIQALILLALFAGIILALFIGLILARRLTEQKFVAISKERTLLKTILASMIEGVISVDKDSKIEFCNTATYRLLSANTRDARGQKLDQVRGFDKLVTTVLEARHSMELVENEIVIENSKDSHGDGENEDKKILTVHALPFSNQKETGAIIVLSDITRLRRLESVRRDFIANVSHEIKTPLTAIKGYTETLLSGALADANNNQRFVEKIDRNANRLGTLVTDLLSLAKIEAEEEDLATRPINLVPIIYQVLTQYEDEVRRKNLDLTCSAPKTSAMVVLGDKEAVYQVFDNLISNAIRYTGEGGKIAVDLMIKQKSAVLSVKDTGIGIPKKDMERVFERFYRVDKARSRELGGTGLGLSIVKHLVSAMNGTIELSSEVGKGSIFTVNLILAS